MDGNNIESYTRGLLQRVCVHRGSECDRARQVNVYRTTPNTREEGEQ